MPLPRKKIFINCPFDKEYRNILNSLLFTIIYFGFEPAISETRSSSDIRINQIKKIIKNSDYSIHDLSRCRPKNNSDPPRFNMPFELGLDIGCLEYGNYKQRRKKILILEKEKYFYQEFLSDISGQDIQNHNDKPIQAIEKIRDWFSVIIKKKTFESPGKIWNYYNDFNDSLIKRLQDEGYKKDRVLNLPISEFNGYAGKWILEMKRINE